MMNLVGGRLVATRATATEGLERYTRRPVAEWHSWTLTQLAELADRTGEPEDAAAAAKAAEEALRGARDSANLSGIVRAQGACGVAALLTGDPHTAVQLLEE